MKMEVNSFLDFNSVVDSDLDGIFESSLQRRFIDDAAWKSFLPKVLDAVNLCLKRFEETEWMSGKSGRLKEEGLLLLANVIRKKVAYANKQSMRVRKSIHTGHQDVSFIHPIITQNRMTVGTAFLVI